MRRSAVATLAAVASMIRLIVRRAVAELPRLACLAALLLAGCASVEETIAAGDAARSRGDTGRAYELYWEAYHKDSNHPLVKDRLGQPKRMGPTHDPGAR